MSVDTQSGRGTQRDRRQIEPTDIPGRQCIVICAGTPWDGPPMSEQHIARGLAKHSQVIYVDPPRSVHRHLSDGVRWRPRSVQVESQLFRVRPIAPPFSHRFGMGRIVEGLAVRQISSALRELNAVPFARIVATDLPLFDPTSGERRILYATDDFAAGASLMGLGSRRVIANQRRLAAEADLVIAVSDVLADQWRLRGCKAICIPNGCDAGRFALTDAAPYPPDIRLHGPIVGFAGQINDRLDFDLLDKISDEGFSLLMIGPITRLHKPERFERMIRRQKTQWVGSKPFADMPSYMRAIHVGITPYRDTSFNQASFPLKSIEYLAAGRAVVSTDLAASRTLPAEHVSVAKSVPEFVRALKARVAEPLDAPRVAQRRTWAAKHSWEARVRQIIEALGLPADDCGLI